MAATASCSLAAAATEDSMTKDTKADDMLESEADMIEIAPEAASTSSSPNPSPEPPSGRKTEQEFNKDAMHSGFFSDRDSPGKFSYLGYRSPGADFNKNDRDVYGNPHNGYPSLVGPHHMANLLRPDNIYHQDASKLLRDMLQSKEKQRYAMENNQFSPLGPDGRIMSKFLQHDSMLFRNGFLNEDDDSRSTSQDGSNSDNESDTESQVKTDSNNPNSSFSKNEDKNAEELDLTADSDADSHKVKKDRVENIISGMTRFSPNKLNGDIALNGKGECKRPKRKQYVPQQHDNSYLEDEPLVKQRKVEHGVIKEQLKQMQEQLAQMQKCYNTLFEQAGATPTTNSNNHLISSHLSATKESKVSEKSKETDSDNKAGESDDYDPTHFIKQASKLVEEQEISSRHSSAPKVSTPSELNKLAHMLKEELKSNVNMLVDSVVQKFIEKQGQKVEKEDSHKKSFEPPSLKEKTKSPGPVRENSDRPSLINRGQRNKVTDKLVSPFFDPPHRSAFDLPRPHMPLFPPPHQFYAAAQVPPHPFYAPKPEPEQTEALPLVVSQPKKKRTKVTDTRLSPRAARALLQEGTPTGEEKRHLPAPPPLHELGRPPMMPLSLPTSVAIPNPSLQHSDVLAMYTSRSEHSLFMDSLYSSPCMGPPGDQSSPTMANTPDNVHMSFMKNDSDAFTDHEGSNTDGLQVTSTLTPMHLRKAKLMFFYVRYPSSAILKIYFPDIKFNKNNTAQLVKWFSNFREFYYIQMEKYARQALAEGSKADDLVITTDCELYRVLNLHYNRNNQIEVPETFRIVVQSTLREFFNSIAAGKDSEQSWKKAIYKIIARMDDQLPDFFKSPNWMEKLNDI